MPGTGNGRIMRIASLLIILAALITSAAQAHSMGGLPEWRAFGEPGKASAVSRTVAVSAQDMRYSMKSLDVKAGETIRFVLTNKGPSKHEFVIGDRAFHAGHIKEMEAMPDMPMDEDNSIDIPPGKVKALIWRFTKPGSYIFGCDMPGHFQAGMHGIITVR